MKTKYVILLTLLFINVMPVHATVDKPKKIVEETLQKNLSDDVIKKLVRDALLEEPEILLEVMQKLKEKQIQNQALNDQQLIKDNYATLFENKNDPFVGAKNPNNSIVVFVDFNCGYCKRFEVTLNEVLKKFPKTRVIYKVVPILGPVSRKAANIALAVQLSKPNNYASLHHLLMSNPVALTEDSLQQAVTSIGLNPNILSSYKTDTINDHIEQNMRLMAELGISGTPAIVLKNQIIRGVVDESHLKTALNDSKK